MHVSLRLILDCDVDRAWELLHSPAAMRFAMSPLVVPTPARGVLPERWPDAEPVELDAALLGILPAGRISVELHDERRDPAQGSDVRIVHDRGGPTTGPLAALRTWRHRMAVSPLPDGRTLFRDRLEIGGIAAGALWPQLWIMWQWRGHRLQALARRR